MILVLSLLGGVLALDQTSLGQFMLARPLVSTTLAGWILGDPGTGLLVGTILEVLFLPAFPVGGARFPEGGPAGVVAAAAMVQGPGGMTAATLALSVGLGTLWGAVGGWTITHLRRLNERVAASPEDERVDASRIVRGHLGALSIDFVRGVILTALGVGVARMVVPGLVSAWPLGETTTVLALGSAAALSLGALLSAFGGWNRRRMAFFGGLVAGVTAGWLL